MDLKQFLADKNADQIEKAIVTALIEAGKTASGREWYTPTAVVVHLTRFAAKTANAFGQEIIALQLCAAHGALDIFGFSGTVKLVTAMLRKAKQQGAKTNGNAKGGTNSGVPDAGVQGEGKS